MMPALFFLFVVLGVYICTLPGASEGYKYIFTLKPEGLLNPQVWGLRIRSGVLLPVCGGQRLRDLRLLSAQG